MSETPGRLHFNDVRCPLVLVCVGATVGLYQRKVDVDTPNAVKDVLADVSSVRPSSEQIALRVQHIHINLSLIQPMPSDSH